MEVAKVGREDGQQMQVLGVGVRFLCEAARTGNAWSLMETVVPRGFGPPAHEHPWDEAYYVVEGEVAFTIGGACVALAAGDFLHAPAGTVHAFQGRSEAPARMLIFDAPAHAEAFFRDVDREVRELPRDLSKVPAIGARHRLRFLPVEPGKASA